jgi:hypothetical protein
MAGIPNWPVSKSMGTYGWRRVKADDAAVLSSTAASHVVGARFRARRTYHPYRACRAYRACLAWLLTHPASTRSAVRSGGTMRVARGVCHANTPHVDTCHANIAMCEYLMLRFLIGGRYTVVVGGE